MLTVFRKNQRVLLLIVAVLTIVAFAFLYNYTDFQNVGKNDVAKIYGRTVTMGEADRYARLYQISIALGQLDLVQSLSGMPGASQEQAVSEFVWNMMILDRETERLGIYATDAEVVERLKQVPQFQTNGAYDPAKYTRFVSEQLSPRGFTERDLEDLVRDSIELTKLKELVGSAATVSEAELNEAMHAYRPVDFVVAELTRTKALSEAVVPAAEIENFFQDNKAHFLTDEFRSVQYVSFPLSEEEAALEGKERVAALQKQADAASAFAAGLTEPDASLESAAAAAGIEVKTSPDFTREGSLRDPVGISPETRAAMIREVRGFAGPAFALTEKAPISEVVQVGNAFYVLKLDHVTPSRPMTLLEATPKIRNELRQRKADEIFSRQSLDAGDALRAAVQAGTPFTEAAEQSGLTLKEFSGVVPMGEGTDRMAAQLSIATLTLEPGEFSPFEPTPAGGAFIYLQSRGEVPDAEKQAANEQEMRTRLMRNKEALMFFEWLRSAREASNLTVLGNA